MKSSYVVTQQKFEAYLEKVDEFYEEGIPEEEQPIYEICEEVQDLMKSSFRDGKSKIFDFKRGLEKVDREETDYFGEHANLEIDNVYRYVNSKKLEFIANQIKEIIKELIQLDDNMTKSSK